MRRVVLAVMLAGCDQLLGLPDIHPMGLPITVTGRYLARVVSNDAQHLPMVTDEPFASITASVWLDDGSTPPVAWNSDGTFSFTAHANQTYALSLVGNGFTNGYQLATPTVDLAEPVYSPLDRVAPAPGTMVSWSLPQPTPSGSVEYASSTGQWSLFEVGTGPASSFTYDWTSVRATPTWGTLGSIGLLDASRGDRLFFGVFEPASPSIMAMTSYRSDDVTLISGAANPLAGATMPLPSPTCVSVNVLRIAELDRLVTAGYGSASSFHGNWAIVALPTPDLGTGGEILLAYSTDGFTTDTMADVNIGNPFDGHALGMYLIVDSTRQVFAPGATAGIPFANATAHVIRVTAPCPTPSTILGMVALPSQPTLDGAALDTDGLSVSLDRTRPAVLGWSVGDRNYESFQVNLYELSVDASGATKARLTAQIRTLQPQAALDPALLETSKTYVVQVAAELGYPSAATGDFRTAAFPSAYGELASHTFTITN
jgi:hypothetical protein